MTYQNKNHFSHIWCLWTEDPKEKNNTEIVMETDGMNQLTIGFDQEALIIFLYIAAGEAVKLI